MNFLISFKLTNENIKLIIEDNITNYILYYCRSLAHRLLKTTIAERGDMTVSIFIDDCVRYNNLLTSKTKLMPLKQFNIRFAKCIDDYFIPRKLYLLFRRIYNRPIYS